MPFYAGTLDAWSIGFGTPARVLAGASTLVTARWVGIETTLGSPRLLPGEKVEVGVPGEFVYSGTGVAMEPFTFTADSTEVGVTLTVSAGATSGTLLATASTLVNVVIEPPFVALVVVIEPREFALAFTTSVGEALETAQVLAGGSTEVWLTLHNAGALLADESMQVSLKTTTVTVDRSELILTAQASSALFVIDAAYNATSPLGVMTSGEVRSGDAVVMNVVVSPVSLAVEVVARRFRLELDAARDVYTRVHSPGVAIADGTSVGMGIQSVRSTIDVVENIMIEALWVAVSITHTHRSDLIVELVSPEEMSLRLHDRTVGSADNLRRIYTARDDPLHSLVGTQARGEWVLTVGDDGSPDAGTLDAWGIGFGTPARVLAGASTLVTARLVGVDTTLGSPRLLPGEKVEVGEFEYGGAGVVAEPFTFTADSTEVGVTLTVSAGATSGTLLATASTLVNVVIEPPFVALVVGIEPREFALAFMPPDIGILAGMTETVTLSLIGVSLSPEDPMVTVALDLSHPSSPDRLELVTSVSLEFDADTMRHAVTLRALGEVTVLEAFTLSASVMEEHGVPNASFTDAGLSVNVVDERKFTWVFRSVETREELREAVVVAGATTQLLISLEGAGGVRLFAGELVQADVDASTGLMLSSMRLRLFLMRVRNREAPVVRLSADSDAVGSAGMLTVRVAAGMVSLSRTTITTQATLPVRVVRAFAFAFKTAEGEALEIARIPITQVLTESTSAVVVTLANTALLAPAESVSVRLTATGVSVDRAGFGLTKAMPSEVMVIGAAGGTGGMITVSGEIMMGGSRVADTRVAEATLPVRVIRRFELRFETAAGEVPGKLQVIAGATTEVKIALVNPELLDSDSGEVVRVTSEATTVNIVPRSVRLTRDDPDATLTISAAADAGSMSGTVVAMGAVKRDGSPVADTSVEPTTLVIFPRELALVFTLPEIGILTGTTETVTLSLIGASLLPAAERVVVGLRLLDDTTVSLVSMGTLTFGASTPRHAVELAALASALTGATTLVASVLETSPNLGDAAISDSELGVNVIEGREFRWVFRLSETGGVLSEAVVVAGATTRLLISLEGIRGADLRAGEEVAADLDISDGLLALPSPLIVRAGTVSSAVALTADSVATSGELQLKVARTTPSMLEQAVEPEATLPVRVVREFELRFETAAGEALEMARIPITQVLTESTTAVVVALADPALLAADESVSVTLTATGVSVDRAGFGLTKAMPSEVIVIGASGGMGGMIAASGEVMVGGSRVADTRVVEAALPVRVVREFALRFETAAGEALEMAQVLTESMTAVVVALLNAGSLESGEVVMVTLDAATVTVDGSSVTLTQETTRGTVTIGADAGVASMSGTVVAMGAVELNGSAVEDTRVGAATLTVDVLAVAQVIREFGLQFEVQGAVATMAQVLAGDTTEVEIALVNPELLDFGSGEAVQVTLDAATVTVDGSSVTLTQETTRGTVTISADAGVASMSGTVVAMGAVELNGSAVEDTRVGAATLTVDVLAVEPVIREFGLQFEVQGAVATMAQVLAGDTTEVEIALLNADSLESGEVVMVTLATTTGVNIALISVTLTRESPSTTLIIGAAADARSLLGSVTATGVVMSGGLPVDDTQVGMASLAVTVGAAGLQLRVRVLLEGPLQ